MNTHSENEVACFVYDFIKKYEDWNRDVVYPNIIEEKKNSHDIKKSTKKEGRRLVESEFNKRIAILFIGPTEPRSYGGIFTKKGYASDRHGVDGEKIIIVENPDTDEWVVETEYSYTVADVPFSHRYKYYIVSVGKRLRFGRIMIIDKNEVAGNCVYQEL